MAPRTPSVRGIAPHNGSTKTAAYQIWHIFCGCLWRLVFPMLSLEQSLPWHLAVSNAESNQKCQRPPAFSGSPVSGGTIMVALCNVGWVFWGKRCPACTSSQFQSPLDFDHGGGGAQQILRTLGGGGLMSQLKRTTISIGAFGAATEFS